MHPPRRPPPTRRGPDRDTLHGTEVPDPFRWLEDPDAAETAAWVAAQNEVTFEYLRSLPDREALRARLTGLLDYERFSVPFTRAGRLFFQRNAGLQNQAVLYTQGPDEPEPRVLLDPNALSADGTVALAVTAPSPDGSRLVYGTSASGSDWNEFRVRDVATGTDLPDHLRWIKFSDAAWTEDGLGFFYGRFPAPKDGEALVGANLGMELRYHRLGAPQEEDPLVYARADQPEWGWAPIVTDDGRYLVLHVWHGTDPRNRIYLAELGDPAHPVVTPVIRPLLDAFDAAYHFLGNDGARFYFLTTDGAPRWRVIAIDLERPAREAWREVIPESDAVLERATLFGDEVVASYLRDARAELRRVGLDGAPRGEIALPGLGSVAGPGGERNDPRMYYAFTSYLSPTTIYAYEFATAATTVFRAPDVGFDPSEYETEQRFFTSRDGTRVPMFVTRRRSLALDGSHRALLYGYGGFGVSLTPAFTPTILPWLERGGIHVVVNLRGGGEYGEAWHEAGMKERKQTVFDDFIAAAEHLIAAGYTNPGALAIEGGSNGGLLVGAAMTQRPELFAAALPAVGVLDMLRFHRFTIGWAWATEYGSADDAALFPVLLAYSPLHRLAPGTDYPATLITTADHDDRVVPAHS